MKKYMKLIVFADVIIMRLFYSRGEVSCRIYGTTSIEGKADMNSGKTQANKERYETRCNLHVFLICHRKYDHEENRSAQGLVHYEGRN